MPVSISKIFDVRGQVIAPNPSLLSLDICAFSQNLAIPVNTVLTFNSYQEFVDYFGLNTPDTPLAKIYFDGYDGSTKKPSKLLVARWVDTAVPAFIVGTKLPTIAELKTITASESVFHLTDATGVIKNLTITDFDMSSYNSYQEIAVALQAALKEANGDVEICNVGYAPTINAFYINDILNGSTSKVLPTTYPTGGTQTNLGQTLGLQAPFIVSPGSDAQTPEDNISNVLNTTSNFAGFVFFYEVENQVNIDVAEYLDQLDDDYAFFLQTKDSNSLIANSPLSIAKQVENYKNIYCQYGTVANTVFSSSIGACIDYINGQSVNWSFKQQTGLTPDVIDDATYNVLLTNKYNFYGSYGLKASSSDFLYNGVITGIYNFIDSLYNYLWLKDSLQNDLVTLFTTAGQISYTPQGYAIIKSALQNSIDIAISNNTISLGVTLSAQQKQELILEFGQDISSVLESNGYLLIVDDAGSSARINRESPICKLVYTYGGSINKIVLDTIQVQ